MLSNTSEMIKTLFSTLILHVFPEIFKKNHPILGHISISITDANKWTSEIESVQKIHDIHNVSVRILKLMFLANF